MLLKLKIKEVKKNIKINKEKEKFIKNLFDLIEENNNKFFNLWKNSFQDKSSFRSKEEYKLGVWSYAYYWAIQEIEVVDDEFKSLDEFVAKNKEIVEDKITEKKENKEKFEKSLEKFNMNFKEFYEVMQEYNNLDYFEQINYQKENGLYKGWL